ncbi:two component transcriptional regulator, LuxR family [Duganella sp. CF402]|uniref:response regulator transcription factor n=1 Tax=unclassified Duganella TaxID=2636909 RepID=UPI0008C9C845|nr:MULTISPECIES: response regulator transcription factor [unclassified Duganella]RZT08014.1 DNA-binding NarL/FixJ family response regulator [Duganella sp. BK701]SEM08565.1 two component transcriptional regulator, LuxR family [Duganella sp. CF402]
MQEPCHSSDAIPSAPILVHVCHGESILKAGLIALLAACPQVRLVAPVGADVIVTDYADALARLKHATHRGARLMVISQREREWDIRTAISAGVHGYLPQRCAADELLMAVQMLGRSQRYFNPELLERATQHVASNNLTSRESQVLALLAQGCCNKRIAIELDIGVGTVKTHVKSLFNKLGATARTHAVVLATQRGMVSSGLA